MLVRGCLYWALLDKRRPVLILSPDIRNERASDVIVAPCSTVIRGGPWHVALAKHEGGVPQVSVIKAEQITTIPRDYVEPEPLGTPLSAQRMAEIERAVLRAI